MLLLIYCPDIDLYFNCAGSTENNKSIMGWGRVSPTTCTALLVNPFRGRYSLNRETDECKNAHLELGAVRERAAACVRMLVCVCREGQSSGAGGGGLHSLFFILGISALGGARRCDKKVVHLGACDARCVIVSPVASEESSIRPFLKWRDRNKPPLPLARNVPALPQPTVYQKLQPLTRQRWMSVRAGGGACALAADLTTLHLLLHGGVTCQLLQLPFRRSLPRRCLAGPRENAGGSVIAEVRRGAQLGDMQNRLNCQSTDASSLIPLCKHRG